MRRKSKRVGKERDGDISTTVVGRSFGMPRIKIIRTIKPVERLTKEE